MSELYQYRSIRHINLLDKIKLLFIKEQCISSKATIDKKVYINKLYYKILDGKIYYTKEVNYDYEIK